MNSELTKAGVELFNWNVSKDDDHVQWMTDHPEEHDEEEDCIEDDDESNDEEQYESGYDADLGSYVSTQLLNGQHTIQIENSDSDFVQYDGEFVQGVREGEGVYSQMDISAGQIDFQYEGEFYNNLPHGKGVATWVENGIVVYIIEGDFVHGLPDSKQPCTVTVEYIPTETSMVPAAKKTMTVMATHVSAEKPTSDQPNNLLEVYWQGVFELSGMMSDETGAEVTGVFDIHGNVLSQKAGRRSRKSINKKKKHSQKKRI
jgi:hypothetical protein